MFSKRGPGKVQQGTVKRIAILVLIGSSLGQAVGPVSAAEFRILDGFPVSGMHGPQLGVSSNGTTVFGSGVFSVLGFRSVYWTPDGGTLDVGLLPGHTSTLVTAASDDLSVLFGSSYIDGGNGHVFRWTRERGIIDLGSLRNGAERLTINVWDTTPDGSTIVGSAPIPRSLDAIAFRWTEGTGLVQITNGYAVAVSDDGRVVAGTSSGGGVFRWTADSGLETLTASGRATDISGDGSVVVGQTDNESGKEQAFCWSVDDGLQLLYLPPGREHGSAHVVSADGTVVVGTMQRDTNSVDGDEVFRWTVNSGLEVLNPDDVALSGLASSPLMSRSGDIVVTQGWSESDDSLRGPVIWREGHGTEFLRDVLSEEFGLAKQIDDWRLEDVRGISPDGNAFIGLAIPRGVDQAEEYRVWVATIPEPSSAALFAFGGLALISLRRGC